MSPGAEEPSLSDPSPSDPLPPDPSPEHRSWRAVGAAQVTRVVHAISEADQATVEDAVLRLSRTRRWLAPLAVVVGAFASLFDGLKLLVSNWRLTIVQLLPAMWIWLALLDLKAHALHGRSFTIVTGPLLVAAFAAIVAITAASFFLNAVFAFAIATPGVPDTRVGRSRAWEHRRIVLAWGTGMGVLLAVATVVADRWGTRWFTLALGAVVGLMMVCYVSVPARLIGATKSTLSRRDRVAAAVVGGAIGAVVCTPPYVLARVGLIMLGSDLLLVPGIVLLAVGLTLQAGAAGSVKAVKLSATLVGSRHPDGDGAPGDGGPITPNG